MFPDISQIWDLWDEEELKHKNTSQPGARERVEIEKGDSRSSAQVKLKAERWLWRRGVNLHLKTG
jgi:hypothetical protein